MKYNCFTFGYQGKSIEALKQQLQTNNALLVDIRCSPYSRAKGWSKKSLQTSLGEKYLHVPELGNLNYKGGSIEIANMDKGCKIVLDLLQSHSVVLMCVCQYVEYCHRDVVASQLEAIDLSLVVEELE